MTYKFTNRANKAIEIANDIALELGHSYIGTEHILYGLAKEGGGIASKVLENQQVIAEDILNKIEELIGKDEPIQNIVDFLIVAICIFFMIKILSKFKKKEEAKVDEVKEDEQILLLREIRDSLKKGSN